MENEEEKEEIFKELLMILWKKSDTEDSGICPNISDFQEKPTHWDLQDLTLATSRILSRDNRLWKGTKPERFPRKIRKGLKIFWMMEREKESESQIRRKKSGGQDQE